VSAGGGAPFTIDAIIFRRESVWEPTPEGSVLVAKGGIGWPMNHANRRRRTARSFNAW
jgi:hypothetical protein